MKFTKQIYPLLNYKLVKTKPDFKVFDQVFCFKFYGKLVKLRPQKQKAPNHCSGDHKCSPSKFCMCLLLLFKEGNVLSWSIELGCNTGNIGLNIGLCSPFMVTKFPRPYC